MKSLFWSGALLCCSFAALAGAEPVQGDNFCSDLMCVTAIVNSSTVLYELTALNQLGWMAVGFGTHMTNSKMVILWQNSDGSVTISQRFATAQVEPVTDPNPPRIATLDQPSTIVSSSFNRLSFIVPNDNTVNQSAVWAYSFVNPNSSAPDADIVMHVEAAAFSLFLNNTIDPDTIPALQDPSSNTTSTGSSNTTSTGSSTPGTNGNSNFGGLNTSGKLIYAHAVISVLGFLLVLPLGALFARWARTLSNDWFFYHWGNQVFLGIPIIVVGWTLGPLAVSANKGGHFNDLHKVLGVLLLPLYICQLCAGVLVHIYKSTSYPKRHPPQSYVHAIFGMLIIGLAFIETRNGFSVEWQAASLEPINVKVLSGLWTAWVVFLPVAYLSGFLLIRRQLAHERALPPPYSRGNGMGTRFRFLGRLRREESADDGTHDVFSEAASDAQSQNAENTSEAASMSAGTTTDGVEMREVAFDRARPISVGNSPARTYLSFSALSSDS